MKTMLTALITFCSLVSVGIVHGQSGEQERNRQRNSNYVWLKRNLRKTGPLVLAIYIVQSSSQANTQPLEIPAGISPYR